MSKYHDEMPFSLWLEWNKAFLEMWDLTAAPWIITEAFAQVLGRGMESYLLMDTA